MRQWLKSLHTFYYVFCDEHWRTSHRKLQSLRTVDRKGRVTLIDQTKTLFFKTLETRSLWAARGKWCQARKQGSEQAVARKWCSMGRWRGLAFKEWCHLSTRSWAAGVYYVILFMCSFLFMAPHTTKGSGKVNGIVHKKTMPLSRI